MENIKGIRTNRRKKAQISYIEDREWEIYYKDLLIEKRSDFMIITEDNARNIEDKITATTQEIGKAIKQMKNNKGSGPGSIAPAHIKYVTDKLHMENHTA